MVKIDLALLALVAFGPALSTANPTDLGGRDAPHRVELVARQSRRLNCAWGGTKKARATTVAACIDSIAEYGKGGKMCTAGATRKLCEKFSSLNIGLNTGGPNYYTRVPCIQWAQDLGYLLDHCTDDRGMVQGGVGRDQDTYYINVQAK